MTNIFCAVFAAIFALLAVTAPARAAYVDALSLTFLDANFTGTVTFNSDYSLVTAASGIISGPGLASPSLGPSSPTPPTLSIFSDNLYPGAPTLGGPYYDVVIVSQGSGGPKTTESVSFVYSIKNGTPALFEPNAGVDQWASVLGDERSTGGSLTPVSPTPLPAALPLFGSALAGLGGVGWLKRRKIS